MQKHYIPSNTQPLLQGYARFLFFIIAVATTLALSWLHASRWLHFVSIDEILRPYIFRQFVPISARILAQTSGLEYRVALVTVILACAVAYLISTHYLYTSFFENNARADLFAILSIAVLFPLLQPPHIYDIATALFFTLALALLARRKIFLYMIILVFASLNRETTFLLPLLFGVHFFKDSKLGWKKYTLSLAVQILIYGWIRYTILRAFSSYPGENILIRPMENLRMYLESPIQGLTILLVSICALWMVILPWQKVPEMIRTALLVFMPILMFLYFVSGKTFEIRVFIEILPVLTMFLTVVIPSGTRWHYSSLPWRVTLSALQGLKIDPSMAKAIMEESTVLPKSDDDNHQRGDA